ncbi:MAG: NAD(P)/FAD-dependent oxidoreductase [Anaerolineae bacterium]
MGQSIAVIIGAGPAGLTAAYELVCRTNIRPLVFEMTADIGGISKTINYRGNRIDLGGHRFFSKSTRVTEWWQDILPVQGAPACDDALLGRRVALSTAPDAPDPECTNRVMLVRQRLSRILFLARFFNYPITLDAQTLRNLGPWRVGKIGLSYLQARLMPIREERTLQDFFINRFGRELYHTFFQDYTEKVWGVPCTAIRPEWGAQRVKGVSVAKVLTNAFRKAIGRPTNDPSAVEASLIEQFLYPKLGPGQMWEEVARLVEQGGGQVYRSKTASGLYHEDGAITAVQIRDNASGREYVQHADYVISSMPIRDLVQTLTPAPPIRVREVAHGLIYRDFVTVGLLLRKLKIRNDTGTRSLNDIAPDNWIYIQEKHVRLGRLQVFNNWSPYLVHDPQTVWVGLEYFCSVGDDLWSMSDPAFARFAISEMVKLDLIDENDVLDSTVLRMPKAYPAYLGTYDQLDVVREYTDRISNLFLVGRNGMHRYNNQDHSMLSAMTAVDNIVAGITDKSNVWAINTESTYHEHRQDVLEEPAVLG